MAAIKSLMSRDEVVHQLAKRQNWAAKEAGVVVVFCIVGVGTSNLEKHSHLFVVTHANYH
jgi:hypothetical protein